MLNGWSYSETRDIIKKTHDLLLAIEKIKELPSHYQERLIPLIDWNIYAFMYIPNYLAGTGYKISWNNNFTLLYTTYEIILV